MVSVRLTIKRTCLGGLSWVPREEISTPACQNLNSSQGGLHEAQSPVPSRRLSSAFLSQGCPTSAYCKHGGQREASWARNGVRSFDGQGPALRSTRGHILSLTSSNTHPANTLSLYTCRCPAFSPAPVHTHSLCTPTHIPVSQPGKQHFCVRDHLICKEKRYSLD